MESLDALDSIVGQTGERSGSGRNRGEEAWRTERRFGSIDPVMVVMGEPLWSTDMK